MLLLGFLPILALLLTIAVLRQQVNRLGSAILTGGVAWAFAIAIGTELLSVLSAVRLPAVLGAWLLVTGVLIVVLLRRQRTAPAAVAGKDRIGRFALALFGGSTLECAVNVVLILIGATTLLLALAYPPNNWDSQTYHLPRIEHWIQNGSLALYPTAIERQIELASFAETLVLQLHLLSGTDRLDNLVQWLAGVGCVVAVGEIALAIRASSRGTALARLTMAALPIGILESTSTQNDLVVAFFVLCAAERLLAWRESRGFRDATFVAAAAGLAIATKGTAYVLALPFGIWFLAQSVSLGRRALPLVVCCAALLLLPNLPTYLRNLSYSGSPLGAVASSTNNADWGLGPFVVNATRNAAVNLATPIRDVNNRIRDTVSDALQSIGLDPNDPDLTWPGTRFNLAVRQTHEDQAGNPVHLILVALSAVLILLGAARLDRNARQYTLCAVAAVIVFVVLLRWQRWITRLQLPLFALCAPLVALLPIGKRPSVLATLIVVALVAGALPAMMYNTRRPVIPRNFLFFAPEQTLFTARPALYGQYRQMADFLVRNDLSQIGLLLGGDDWEYPIWRFLRTAGLEFRLEHIRLEGRAAAVSYPLGVFTPQAIISTTVREPQITLTGHSFRKELELPYLVIYRAL